MMNDFDNEAILPDGFDPSNADFKLSDWDNPTEPTVPTTEPEAVVSTESTEQTGETTVSTEEPTTTPEETEVPAIPQTLKVKFNHEERELTLDEATEYAQKGMNYDKLEEKVRAYEEANAKGLDLAKKLGYKDVEEMHEAAANNLYKRKVKELVEAGNTQAMAEFLVKQEMGQAPTPTPTEEKPQEKPTPEPSKSTIPNERKAELDEFVKAYPNVTTLPDEVVAANRAGTRLLVAYERFLNKGVQKENAILKQNQAAAAKAPVTGVTGRPSTETEKTFDDDPFMKGFNSDEW